MIFKKRGIKVLAIGAHPDDIEIGAGGFIKLLTEKYGAQIEFLILTTGTQGIKSEHSYNPNCRRTEAIEAAKRLGVPQENVNHMNFPDCQLHQFEHQLIRAIESVLYDADRQPRFDMVLTHVGADTHADHRVVYESTISAVRYFHGTVLCYPAPSTKPNGFRPTFFVMLDQDDLTGKNFALEAHVSQKSKVFMDAKRTLGLSGNWALFHRLSGHSYLEAFEVYKAFF